MQSDCMGRECSKAWPVELYAPHPLVEQIHVRVEIWMRREIQVWSDKHGVSDQGCRKSVTRLAGYTVLRDRHRELWRPTVDKAAIVSVLGGTRMNVAEPFRYGERETVQRRGCKAR